MATKKAEEQYEETEEPVDFDRRQWLRALAVLPVAAAVYKSGRTTQAANIAHNTSAHIVIAGGGLGGIAVANRLRQMLIGARITIVDAKEEHNYQPGYTLVANGIWPVHKVRDWNAHFHAQGIEWIRENVAHIDPESQWVETFSGTRMRYDFLIVATGLHLDYAQIEGMDVNAIGQNGLTSVYAGPQGAQATWEAIQKIRQTGGNVLMTLPDTPLKCAGAPLKMTFMLRDHLRKSDVLGQSHITFHSAPTSIFSVKLVNDRVLQRWQTLDINFQTGQTLKAIDIGAQQASFLDSQGKRLDVNYDFIHVVPPMRAPDVIQKSALACPNGPLKGWLEVDMRTLQHRRFPNVFGVGDVNGTPRGKTAATVKKSAPIVAHNLVETIAGRAPSQSFDGYTSCPMLLREGVAWLIEFDYEGRLTPSMPMIEPLKDSYAAWLMKCYLLKPAYLAVLKGNI